MSDYQFGLGRGHLPKKANTIASKHGAALVNYTDPGCSCGYGCDHIPARVNKCPANRRHWFTTRNYGEPFDSSTARAVMADLRAAGVVKDAR